jgi:hypothetical protein
MGSSLPHHHTISGVLNHCVFYIYIMFSKLIKTTVSYALCASVIAIGIDSAYKAISSNYLESLCTPVLKYPGVYECDF